MQRSDPNLLRVNEKRRGCRLTVRSERLRLSLCRRNAKRARLSDLPKLTEQRTCDEQEWEHQDSVESRPGIIGQECAKPS